MNESRKRCVKCEANNRDGCMLLQSETDDTRYFVCSNDTCNSRFQEPTESAINRKDGSHDLHEETTTLKKVGIGIAIVAGVLTGVI